LATLEDIQLHYDVGNDFFDIFLDRRYKIYSCAVWENIDDLESAQTRKLARMSMFSGVKPYTSILDVGCGWGGMMRYLLDDCHVSNVTGLTLSDRQFDFVKSLKLENSEVQVCSWSDFQTNSKFDSIVSIGAFEHFASLDDRVAGNHLRVYERFFKRCHQLTNEGSGLGLQTIVLKRAPSTSQEFRDTQFLLRKVFPGSALPTVDDIHTAMLGFYKVREVLTIGQNYARTLLEWKSRLRQHEKFALENHGRQLVEHYLTYFDAARRSFENGVVDLAQFSLEREDV
jgi:cyclopropane-fatty-acyl-phospholipid synthase